MKIQREAITGLCILGVFAIARGASAQDPWAPTDTTPTSLNRSGPPPLKPILRRRSTLPQTSRPTREFIRRTSSITISLPRGARSRCRSARVSDRASSVTSGNDNLPSVSDISGPGGTISPRLATARHRDSCSASTAPVLSSPKGTVSSRAPTFAPRRRACRRISTLGRT